MADDTGILKESIDHPRDYPPLSISVAKPTRSFTGLKVPDYAENISLGLLLSDITSLILLSLSTEKFLEKTQVERSAPMFSTKSSRRETFQLLEAAGSTIDVLYDLMEREQTAGSKTISQAMSPGSDFENTLVKRKPSADFDERSRSSGDSDETVREGAVEQSTCTNDMERSLSSSRSGEYYSCESVESSKSTGESNEQLISSPEKRQKPRLYYSREDITRGNGMRRSSSSHSLSHLDRRSTVDSGIASPQYMCQSARASDGDTSKDDSHLFESPQLKMEHDVVNRVQKLKLTVDQKLRDSLANLSSWYSEDDGTASLREHVKTMKIRYEKATTEEWKSGAMHDIIMDKALTTSVLAMENAQLGSEVNALREELQLTYEEAKGQELKGLFVSRLSENLKGMREAESDSEESSSEMSTPDTQLLHPSYLRGPDAHHTRDQFATPPTGKERQVPVSSGKKRLKVPPDLKGHTYLSVSRSSVSSSSRIGSSSSSGSGSTGSDSTDSSGCCGGLFCCFSRRKGMHEKLITEEA